MTRTKILLAQAIRAGGELGFACEKDLHVGFLSDSAGENSEFVAKKLQLSLGTVAAK